LARRLGEAVLAAHSRHRRPQPSRA
jgi:hypothetical protein